MKNNFQLQSEILSDSLYQTKWYKLDTALQRDLMLVIIRSRKPLLLTAGPLGNFNFAMMVAVSFVIG